MLNFLYCDGFTVYFFIRFCEEHYKYSPVLGPKFRRIYGLKHTPAIAAVIKEEKKNKRSKKEKVKAVPVVHETAEEFPNYLNISPATFRTVKGAAYMLRKLNGKAKGFWIM